MYRAPTHDDGFDAERGRRAQRAVPLLLAIILRSFFGSCLFSRWPFHMFKRKFAALHVHETQTRKLHANCANCANWDRPRLFER